jgi:flagellar biosynthetic protein FliO
MQGVLLFALAQSAADELPAGTGGFGAQLARTSLALLVVCVAAWALVRFAARRGMLGAPARGRHLAVIERVALDPRRSVFLLRVGKRGLVLGASEDGLRTLAELSESELREATEQTAAEREKAGDEATDEGESTTTAKAPRSFSALLRGPAPK